MINGAACVPAVLSLDHSKTLALRDANQEGFAVPLSEATIKFTSWGTMIINVADKKYDVLGVGGSLSPNPSKEQLEEIKAAAGSNTSKNDLLTKAGSVGAAMSTVSAGASALGAASMEFAYYDGLEAIKEWQVQLVKAGATVKTSKMKSMTYYLWGLAIAFVVILTIAIRMKK